LAVAAIVGAGGGVPARAAAADPAEFRVEHEGTDDVNLVFVGPPQVQTSDAAITAWVSHIEGPYYAGCQNYTTDALVSSTPGLLHFWVYIDHISCDRDSRGRAKPSWLVHDLVFTSTDGQTGDVMVQLKAELYVEHGGGCTPQPPSDICDDGDAEELWIGNVGPELISGRYRSAVHDPGWQWGHFPPPGWVDVTGPANNVTLGDTISFGPWIIGHVFADQRNGEDGESSFLEVMLRLGDIDGVFILPEGITVNAPSIGLEDNHFVGVPTAVESRSWGAIKSLYR
jgi:hypothetical protein